MLNAPFHTLSDARPGVSCGQRVTAVVPRRIYSIGGGFCLLAVIVLVRVAWLQSYVADSFLAALETTTTEYEVIPARDGRILTASLVLAADVERYDLQLHYRWLEQPPNESWLTSQIRRRLTRDERRDPRLVAETREEILGLRHAMQDAFRELCGLTEAEFAARCAAIQRDVERVADVVNRHHADSHEPAAVEDGGFLLRIAAAVRRALTTPPRRTVRERIVVREEESYHTVVADVALATAARISEHPEQFPGTRAVPRTVRSYPQGSLAAHAVGARSPLRDDEPHPELPADGRIIGNPVTRRGRFGVERSYDDAISGRHGLRRIVRDRRQRVIHEAVLRAPQSGRDVVLTLDAGLQRVCEELLSEALADTPLNRLLPDPHDEPAAEPRPVPVGGSIVVMEAATGRLLAAASAPSFELSLFTGASAEDWDAANADPRRPFIARFSGMALPPGSTFKVLTSIAALESGAVDAESPVFCQGYLTRPSEHRCLIFRRYGRGHDHVDLAGALSESCNVYFFEAARTMGIRTLVEWTDRLQFGNPTGVDLPFETPGKVPPAPGDIRLTSGRTSRPEAWEREALGLAIGQSRLTTTPLQVARLLGVIANGGWLVTPHVVSEEGVARSALDTSTAPPAAPRHRVRNIRDSTIHAIRRGLTAAVAHPAGTGFRDVRTDEIAVAGKTGTAETAPGRPDHAWFAGYVPAADPQIVIVVVLEHGGSGSHAAGPVAREVAREIARRRLL